jgi:8-oxo-dGTP pyrophosphatase MutT (NUDIX family)
MPDIADAKPPKALEAAATAVVLRDSPDGPEVLMVERPSRSSSFAGAWVFPGGKVDPEDSTGLSELGMQAEMEAARRAAVREVREETGLQLAPADLVPSAAWEPPAEAPRRFRTWFFLAPAPQTEVVLNEGELIGFQWLSPRDILRRHETGTMHLVPPTWVTLHSLLDFATVEEGLGAVRAREPEAYTSRMLTTIGEGKVIAWAGDELYVPGGKPGGRHRLDMHALPWVYERKL